jgi:hypothetical protein
MPDKQLAVLMACFADPKGADGPISHVLPANWAKRRVRLISASGSFGPIGGVKAHERTRER